ncbi:MAG TPA: DUF5694 domain-containing protein [Allosphingosinicella sp.]|jgi:hypothetical protein
MKRLFAMSLKAAGLAAVAALAGTAAAQGYQPTFDPSRLKAENPSPVLVLGTSHLSGWPASVPQQVVDPLLERLAAWKPDAIAIEALSGVQCDYLRRHPARHSETVKSYCWDTAAAAAATGLDVPAATAEADRLLAAWPADPTAAQRRRLAAVFLAGGEQASALVQWLRLPEAERRAGDGLDAALVARLESLRTRRNEDYWIAAPLAARLGLERVHPVDDHSSYLRIADEEAYGAAVMRAWDNPVSAQRREAEAAIVKLIEGEADILSAYRRYNQPEQAVLAYRGDFGAALGETSPQRFGRQYVGGWETRNLRMVANIREVIAARPGGRVLAIVGVSHKGYYEDYLHRMHDVVLADVREVLR